MDEENRNSPIPETPGDGDDCGGNGGDAHRAAAGGAAAIPSRAPAACGIATREKRSRAGVNSRLADYSVEIGHEPAAWVDEWTPKRGRWGGRGGRGRGGRGGGGGWRSDIHAENKDRDRWEACGSCKFWVNLGRADTAPCPLCGTDVAKTDQHDFESWAQCDECGKWRNVPDETARKLERAGDGAKWACSMLRKGATCRTSTADWATIARDAALRERLMQHSGGRGVSHYGPGGRGVHFIGGRGLAQAARRAVAAQGEGDAAGGGGDGDALLPFALLPGDGEGEEHGGDGGEGGAGGNPMDGSDSDRELDGTGAEGGDAEGEEAGAGDGGRRDDPGWVPRMRVSDAWVTPCSKKSAVAKCDACLALAAKDVEAGNSGAVQTPAAGASKEGSPAPDSRGSPSAGACTPQTPGGHEGSAPPASPPGADSGSEQRGCSPAAAEASAVSAPAPRLTRQQAAALAQQQSGNGNQQQQEEEQEQAQVDRQQQPRIKEKQRGTPKEEQQGKPDGQPSRQGAQQEEVKVEAGSKQQDSQEQAAEDSQAEKGVQAAELPKPVPAAGLSRAERAALREAARREQLELAAAKQAAAEAAEQAPKEQEDEASGAGAGVVQPDAASADAEAGGVSAVEQPEGEGPPTDAPVGGSAAVNEAAAAANAGPTTTAAVKESWLLSDLPLIGKFEEYVMGRDTLIGPETLAEGFDAADALSGEHVLSVLPLPRPAFNELRPFVDRCLELFRVGSLPLLTDGRVSAGPVDLTAFLAQPHIQQQVYQALTRREARLRAQGLPLARNPHDNLSHVIHVSPDGRKVYIGEEGDTTIHGGSIMGFAKSWKSGPIHSWSGGKKLADMPGARPNQVVLSKLSLLMGGWEHLLEAAADHIWAAFEAHDSTRDAAKRMLNFLQSSELQSSSRLGRSGWNAYSLNISYRTAVHLDGKNVPGSYSALVILEYRRALDVRQGLVLFHRSGDAPCGLHGNSRLWRDAPDRHRVAIVLYQTQLGKGPTAPGGPPSDGAAATAEDGSGAAAGEDGAQQGQDGEGSGGSGGEGSGGATAAAADGAEGDKADADKAVECGGGKEGAGAAEEGEGKQQEERKDEESQEQGAGGDPQEEASREAMEEEQAEGAAPEQAAPAVRTRRGAAMAAGLSAATR